MGKQRPRSIEGGSVELDCVVGAAVVGAAVVVAAVVGAAVVGAAVVAAVVGAAVEGGDVGVVGAGVLGGWVEEVGEVGSLVELGWVVVGRWVVGNGNLVMDELGAVVVLDSGSVVLELSWSVVEVDSGSVVLGMELDGSVVLVELLDPVVGPAGKVLGSWTGLVWLTGAAPADPVADVSSSASTSWTSVGPAVHASHIGSLDNVAVPVDGPGAPLAPDVSYSMASLLVSDWIGWRTARPNVITTSAAQPTAINSCRCRRVGGLPVPSIAWPTLVDRGDRCGYPQGQRLGANNAD